MKIDEQIRTAYVQQRAMADRLKVEVDREVVRRKSPSWHYQSRVKSEESFALKVEAGMVADPTEIEDAFACVVVVPNATEIIAAEKLILGLYGDPDHRRPLSHTLTQKSPSDFRFDDLRLYMRYQDQGFGPPSGLAGCLFEVQVKTFLQHAWSIATHDVVYKSDDVSWRRERIAHQAKAALEQAEVTIGAMSALETSQVIPETNEEMKAVNELIAIIKNNWDRDQLPADLRRLAGCVNTLLRNLNLKGRVSLDSILAAGRASYGGSHNLDWSPYRAILQYISEQFPTNLQKLLSSSDRRIKVFIYPAILEQLRMTAEDARRAVLLPVT